jgi:NagD protein
MGGSMDGKPRIFWGWPPLHSINKERLTMRHGYLIDMDGVLYRGSEMIAGADSFVRELRRREISFRFLTNNSQRTRRDIVAKLGPMGIEVEEEHVYTCAMATAAYLEWQKPGGTAFVIGEGGLLNALHAHGYAIVDNDPDYVVVGEGRTFNLELVEAAVRMILRGAKLVATNLDPNCPTKDGLRPGCGAMVAMLETAAGVRAFSVGKPSPFMMRAARKDLGLSTDETTMIGDTMETDILGGVQLGLHTVLVLTGGTKRWIRLQICINCWCSGVGSRGGVCRARWGDARAGERTGRGRWRRSLTV